MSVSKERLMTILLAPIISEKSTLVAEQGFRVFRVRKDATKAEIKAAVELMFDDVKVESVKTAVQKGKFRSRNFKGGGGYRADTKKAYIKLAADSKDIEIGTGA